MFHLALHHSLQLVNRLGSAKSGAELYHHSAAALTQERRGDQAITIEGTTSSVRTPALCPKTRGSCILCHLTHVGCQCPCICTSSGDVHGLCAHQHLLISKPGKSTSYNARECVI